MITSLAADLALLAEDRTFLEEHRATLREQYPDQWVAVLDRRIVGVSSDAERLLEELQTNGVPLERLVIDQLNDPDEILILTA